MASIDQCLPSEGVGGSHAGASTERLVAGLVLSARRDSLGPVGVESTSARKTLEAARGGSRNIRFRAMVSLLEALGFSLARVGGSHHIFVHPAVAELVNLQDVQGKCKPYQVRQVLALVDRYNLKLR